MDRAQIRAAAQRLLPSGSARRDLAKIGLQAGREVRSHAGEARHVLRAARPRLGEPYAAWAARHRASADTLDAQRAALAARSPLVEICFVVVDRGRGRRGVDKTLRSLARQSFQAWTAVVVGAEPSADDPRVKASSASDVASALSDIAASGPASELVVVLHAGDECEPDLAFLLVDAAWQRPNVDVLHWDDDVFDGSGAPHDPRFRPSWSPDMLLSANYIGRSVAIRRRRLQEVGGYPQPGDGIDWWDLLLSLDLDVDEVERLPRVLLHLESRPVASDGGAALVERHLMRRGSSATTEKVGADVRVRWALPDPPSVTIVIPTRHNRAFMDRCLRSIAATAYPALEVRVVDNGGQSAENSAWYDALATELKLDLRVRWWDEAFNYSRVNNVVAAEDATGEVLVFLNDDTEALDPEWLHELVGWTAQPGVGLVGGQLLDEHGLIQHGGVIVGLNGFADHLFEGMPPGSDSLLGPTSWYRNVLSVTAACVAAHRSVFERLGGFDERFILCGSDVALGLDAMAAGLRNVCTPFVGVRHLESATRGSSVPEADFFASYWPYHKWLVGGDPYFSPNLSMYSREPQLRDDGEISSMQHVAGVVNRPFTVFRQSSTQEEVNWLATICRADAGLRPRVEAAHAQLVGPRPVTTVNWFLPDIDSPFYGGINTALRIADQLAADHGVANRFVVMAPPNEAFFRSALAAAFPRLADSAICFYDGSVQSMEANVPASDVAIATLWVTAYAVAQFTRTSRRFYLIQDFEPMFYPAGSLYALTEETYRLGLYGLCNTERLRNIYADEYDGTGYGFMPAVQSNVFHADGRRPLEHDGPARVFVYARPGHWRNCWELAGLALDEVKRRYGDGVHLVTAGSWAGAEDLGRGIDHRGLLDYRDTGDLYRTCDVGVALTLSKHPSYLPLELLACGVPVVAFDNPAGDWILEHEGNSLRCPRTVDGLADAISRLVEDQALRARLSTRGLESISARHSDWHAALGGIHDFLVDPESARG